MSSSCAEPIAGKFLVPLESDIFNVLNFLLFDLVIISLVFTLTGDIAGLLNTDSAIHGVDNRLFPYNPPLVGVGLTCTRKNVFRVLALMRYISLVVVLATNFLIDGSTCQVESRQSLNVVVPGVIDPLLPEKNVRVLTLLRRSCMGFSKSQLGTETYYGEIRANHSCELRLSMMVTKPVFFGLQLVTRNVTPPRNCKSSIPDEEELGHIKLFECPSYGTVACPINEYDETDTDTCEGLVKVGGESLMCTGSGLFPGTPSQNRSKADAARCRTAKNINITDTSWIGIRRASSHSFRDTIDAIYGAGVKKMEVRVASPAHTRNVSEVNNGWIWVMFISVLLVLSLGLYDAKLRCSGLRPTANTELGLGFLLAHSTSSGDSAQASGQVTVQENGSAQGSGDIIMLDNDPHLQYGAVRQGSVQLFVQNKEGVLRTRILSGNATDST